MKRALVLAGAALAAIPPWVIGTDAWPEMILPAYFTLHGRVLYDSIIFPHTPLLILTTALLGKIFGFSAILFRSMIAAAMAATGVLIVAGQTDRQRALLGLAVGVPAYAIFVAYCMGVSLWPDPLMVPLVVLAALALERNELRKAALVLGICILTKQTSAWLLIGATVWLIAVRRERAATLASFVAWASLPYAIFAVAWGLIFRTTSHIYWTLLMPLAGHGSEILTFSTQELKKGLLLFFIAPLFLVATKRWRSPLPWIAIAAWGMAWPRCDIQHLSSATGVLALMTIGIVEAARDRKVAAVALIIGFAAIAVDLPWWRIGGGVLFWDDPGSRFFSAEVRRRIPPGGAFLNYNTPFQNLYVLTNTTTPVSIYVNPSFWYYLNKRDVGDRFCRDLASRHGVLVLFTDLESTDDRHIAETCIYRLAAGAPIDEPLASPWIPPTSWRRIP